MKEKVSLLLDELGSRDVNARLGLEREGTGERFVYDIVRMQKPTLLAKSDLTEEVIRQLYEPRLTEGRPSTVDSISNYGASCQGGKFAAGDYRDIDTDIITWRKPGEQELAMGETEQSPAGLAAGIEKKETLRPWTKKMSPADLAKPIAFDAADMLMFWKAVTGSMRNPHVQKGERAAGRKNAIGLNVGGGNIENDRIEIVSKLFGVLDRGDTAKLKEACVADGFFKDENPDWCSHMPKSMIKAEHERSVAELDKRTRELFHKRVMTGEGGQHYATQVSEGAVFCFGGLTLL